MADPITMTREELTAEHEMMEACHACHLIQEASDRLHALLKHELMTLREWGDASHLLWEPEKRHRAEAHPRYDAEIQALAEKRREAERASA